MSGPSERVICEMFDQLSLYAQSLWDQSWANADDDAEFVRQTLGDSVDWCEEPSGWHDEGLPMLCSRLVGHEANHWHPELGQWAEPAEGDAA